MVVEFGEFEGVCLCQQVVSSTFQVYLSYGNSFIGPVVLWWLSLVNLKVSAVPRFRFVTYFFVSNRLSLADNRFLMAFSVRSCISLSPCGIRYTPSLPKLK